MFISVISLTLIRVELLIALWRACRGDLSFSPALIETSLDETLTLSRSLEVIGESAGVGVGVGVGFEVGVPLAETVSSVDKSGAVIIGGVSVAVELNVLSSSLQIHARKTKIESCT